MRNEHYSLALVIPSKKDPKVHEVHTFRIITSDRMSETRADVFEGRLAVLEGMQWFLRVPSAQVLTEQGVVDVLRTQHRPRYEYTTGEYINNVAVIHPDSPYAVRVINALYLYGDITAATRDYMKREARDQWALHQRLAEKSRAFEQVKEYLATGELTARQLRSLAEADRRKAAASKQSQASVETPDDEQDVAEVTQDKATPGGPLSFQM